jgi:acyl-ACP thioesterase
MTEPGAAVLLPRPTAGRVFETGRRVRLGDVDPGARCRLDSIVRYLQDVARDDSADGSVESMTWVVRRTMLVVHRFPVFQEWLDIATWCSGHGGRWAERRTDLRGDRGARVDTVTTWVFVDLTTGRPAPLPDAFHEVWGEAAGGRRVSARTTLPTSWPDDAVEEPWPLRYTDLDVLAHANNAAQWSAVEEGLQRVGWSISPVRAELEHGPGIDAGTDVRFRWLAVDGGVDTWLTTDGVTGSAARVRPLRDADRSGS